YWLRPPRNPLNVRIKTSPTCVLLTSHSDFLSGFREGDVLRLIAKGLSNREIAARLAITEGTVKTHVIGILSKLGVNDRTAAVTTAIQRGIIFLE
ncbi:MAG: response regulator transcription factor, partial [Acidobacteria bacterium]|nr:response regulator transcription factor [Acidobacteriota bacterium]